MIYMIYTYEHTSSKSDFIKHGGKTRLLEKRDKKNLADHSHLWLLIIIIIMLDIKHRFIHTHMFGVLFNEMKQIIK